MHALDGTIIRGPERQQSPRTVGKPANNLACMLYSVYAVLSVYCTRCMPYSVSTDDHDMERKRGMTSLCDLQ